MDTWHRSTAEVPHPGLNTAEVPHPGLNTAGGTPIQCSTAGVHLPSVVQQEYLIPVNISRRDTHSGDTAGGTPIAGIQQEVPHPGLITGAEVPHPGLITGAEVPTHVGIQQEVPNHVVYSRRCPGNPRGVQQEVPGNPRGCSGDDLRVTGRCIGDDLRVTGRCIGDEEQGTGWVVGTRRRVPGGYIPQVVGTTIWRMILASSHTLGPPQHPACC